MFLFLRCHISRGGYFFNMHSVLRVFPQVVYKLCVCGGTCVCNIFLLIFTTALTKPEHTNKFSLTNHNKYNLFAPILKVKISQFALVDSSKIACFFLSDILFVPLSLIRWTLVQLFSSLNACTGVMEIRVVSRRNTTR